MKKYLSIILLIGYILISMEGMAQLFRKRDKTTPTYGFVINDFRNSVQIPFKIYSNLIVIPLIINDSDTLNFILDTGVSSVFITDPAAAENLNLEYVRKVEISGAGEKDALMAQVSVGHQIKLGEVTGYLQNLVVISEDILHLSEFLGVEVHGIFGHALFENFVVNIDFSTLQLNITKPSAFKYRKRYGEKYPIIVTNSKPYTEAISILSDSGEHSLKLVIDTGAGHALLLNSENGQVALPDKVIRANLGRGLNGDLFGNIGRLSKISLGKYQIDNILASFPDSISFSMKFPPSETNRQGSIGGEFLRRFVVTLNYHEGYMALKPIKKRLKQPYEHDMSGMDVRAFKDNFHRFYVRDVMEGSPAALAGLQKDDEILFVNHVNAQNLTVTEIYKILSKKEGKTIEIFYRRNGQLGFTSFVLKRII